MAFAGDALLCVFVSEEGNNDAEDDACLRALRCGCEMRGHHDRTLATHIGITSGMIELAVLGGLNGEWTYLINGPCMEELSHCIFHAGPREVVISRSCYEMASQMKGVKLDSKLVSSNGYYAVVNVHHDAIFQPFDMVTRTMILDSPISDALQEAAELFVPFPALEAIYAGTLDYVARLQKITTMFLMLDTYSPVKHRDPTTLQPFFYLLQEVLEQSGGYLRQFLVDDKGCVAIAMWGVPCLRYANDGARAVACAIAMSQRVQKINHRVSIGVMTGTVYCGDVGSINRRDYVGVGTSVNTACRLMEKANGKVLIDAATFDSLPRKTKELLRLNPTEYWLKGRPEPLRPYFYDSMSPIQPEPFGVYRQTSVEGGNMAVPTKTSTKVRTFIDRFGGGRIGSSQNLGSTPDSSMHRSKSSSGINAYRYISPSAPLNRPTSPISPTLSRKTRGPPPPPPPPASHGTTERSIPRTTTRTDHRSSYGGEPYDEGVDIKSEDVHLLRNSLKGSVSNLIGKFGSKHHSKRST